MRTPDHFHVRQYVQNTQSNPLKIMASFMYDFILTSDILVETECI
uniref:Uncharacterized protein n=1 Tax=Anguilla anguilla TaxID=7936 RepID=A0A0E9SB27_ANGAN